MSLPLSRMQKQFTTGTHRAVAPGETLARIKPFFAEIGITRLANVTGLDSIGIPVAQAVRPNSKSLSVSQGKGATLDCALVSAAMESIEGYHAEQISGPVHIASYQDLSRRSFALADPYRLPANQAISFRPDRPIAWIEGYDWTHRGPVWAPFDLVHLDFTVGRRVLDSGFEPSSSGLASGNHLLEALSHALCESIERDSIAACDPSDPTSRQRRKVALSSVDEPACRQVLEQFRSAGIRVTVWDNTSALGVPCFSAEIDEPDAGPFRRVRRAGGSGCHPSRSIALLRALTEAAQSRLTYIAGSRDDMTFDPSERPSMFEGAGGEPPAAVSYSSIPDMNFPTIDEDVQWLVSQLQACGFDQVIVFDLTIPAFGIPVVRVLIPGLQTEKRSVTLRDSR